MAAEFAAQHLYGYFQTFLKQENMPVEALRKAFQELEKQFLEKARQENIFDGKVSSFYSELKKQSTIGTTVAVVVAYNHKLVVANVGDSEIHLSRNGNIIPLCEVHNIGKNPQEKQRVIGAGGQVGEHSIIHPVNPFYGKISVSRSM